MAEEGTARRLASIVGMGAQHPLGVTALSFAMASRADLLLVRETRFVDARGDAIGVCHSDALPDELHGFDRLVALAAPALAEATRDRLLAAPAFSGPWPLVIALPDAGRPDDDARYDTHLVAALSQAGGVAIGRTLVVRGEQAAGARALEQAVALLGEAEEVIVGAVDSYYDPRALAWLDASHRLHAPGAADGFIPAEGAAFLRLRSPQRGGACIARLRALASGQEEAGADGPCIAQAMTRLCRELLDDGEVGWVMTDENGETYRTEEWSMVRVREARLGGAVSDPLARRIGDTGAATGLLAAVLGGAWWSAACAPASSALIALHSQGGARGGLVIERAS